MKNVMIECPICGRQSDSIKHIHIITEMTFLIVAANWKQGDIYACPDCARKEVKKYTYKISNILLGNLGWLFIILPFNSIALLRCNQKGHSRKVLKKLGIK